MESYKFSQLPYTPTDFEAVQQELNRLTAQISGAASADEVAGYIARCDALMDEVRYAGTLTYIRSSLDCTDEFYQDAVQKENVGWSMLDTSGYYKALLDSPFLPQLTQRYGSQFRPALEQNFRLHAAGHELLAREQVLVSQYQQKKASLRISFRGQLHSESEMFVFFESPDRQTRIDARKALAQAVLEQAADFSAILLELIRTRDQIAKANGFETYLEYANAAFSRRGYGEAELDTFCQQVKQELVPLLCQLQEEQRNQLGLEKLMSYDSILRFADGNAIPAGDAAYLTEQSKRMYDDLCPSFGQFFRNMVDTESLDVSASANKVAGMGFCTELRSGLYPYVFGNCNKTAEDVSVFTHEIGHAWQCYLTTQNVTPHILRDMPLDAVEIPSKTMELFTYSYAERFFGTDAEKFRQGHFRSALSEIASFCAIHELNTWIYTHTDASFEELTAQETRISRLYQPLLDYGELEPFHAQGADLMRNMAVYMFPRYVISYALSEMCAMDLFRQRQEDPAAAWDAYEKLCASGGSRNYPDTLAQAGLEPAYAEGRVRKVVAFAREYLNH